jgi:hypothetical protein
LVRVNPNLRLTPGAYPAPRTVVLYTLHSVVERLAPPVPSHWREDEEAAVDVLIERCAGIDVGKDEVVACLRAPASSGRGRRKQTRTSRSHVHRWPVPG